MNTCIIFGSFVGIGLIGLLFVAIVGIKSHEKNQNRLQELSLYNTNVNSTISAAIPELLESFVSFEFEMYQAKFLVNEDDSDSYITDEQEKEIIDDLTSICSKRLSPAMMDKLSLFWRKEAIASVVADQIYLQVIAFRSKRNAARWDNNNKVGV